jgi:hypothetical protein
MERIKLQTRGLPSYPRAHPKPVPVPVKTRTRRHGYGFSRVRVRVAEKNPRVTRGEPYLSHLLLLSIATLSFFWQSTIRLRCHVIRSLWSLAALCLSLYTCSYSCLLLTFPGHLALKGLIQ